MRVRTSRRPRLAGRRAFLIAAGAVVVGLLLAEGALRLAGVRFDASFFRDDRELGWGLRPGARGWHVSEGEAFVAINANGQRDAERTLEKPAGAYRVAVLGDSMVEARQVPLEQTFAQVMERHLSRCAGRAVEVLNFGVPGYGTAQELLQLRSRVWPYRPDLVLLTAYLGNDLWDNLRSLDPLSPDRRPFLVRQGTDFVLDDSFEHRLPSPWRARVRAALADVMNASRLLQLVNHVRVAVRSPRAVDPVSASGGPPAGYLDRWPYLEPNHPAHVEAWLTTEGLIGELRIEVERRGAPFLLLYLPMVAETDPDPARREEFRQSLGADGRIDYPRNRVASLARSAGIPLLDPTLTLLDFATSEKSYVNGFSNTAPNTGHLNESGHRIVGDFVGREICKARFAAKAQGL